jgi:hypothetical protein
MVENERLGDENTASRRWTLAAVTGTSTFCSGGEQSGLEMKWSESAIDFATRDEHVVVLQWWKDSGLC